MGQRCSSNATPQSHLSQCRVQQRRYENETEVMNKANPHLAASLRAVEGLPGAHRDLCVARAVLRPLVDVCAPLQQVLQPHNSC